MYNYINLKNNITTIKKAINYFKLRYKIKLNFEDFTQEVYLFAIEQFRNKNQLLDSECKHKFIYNIVRYRYLLEIYRYQDKFKSNDYLSTIENKCYLDAEKICILRQESSPAQLCLFELEDVEFDIAPKEKAKRPIEIINESNIELKIKELEEQLKIQFIQ